MTIDNKAAFSYANFCLNQLLTLLISSTHKAGWDITADGESKQKSFNIPRRFVPEHLGQDRKSLCQKWDLLWHNKRDIQLVIF